MTKLNNDAEFQFQAIGYIQSCYKEKFGVPRQPGLAPAATGQLRLVPPYNQAAAVRGLEHSSHIWLQFVFHQCLRQAWKPTVRPPRLGGNERVGVFATRSTFRPNAIGLSVVKLDQIDTENNEVILHLSGLDLVDGTPILDIKPYIPYVDKVDEAHNTMASDQPEIRAVRWTTPALEELKDYEQQHGVFKALVEQVLQQDPRPAYKKNQDEEKVYGIHLGEANVQFKARAEETDQERIYIEVIALK